MPGQYAPLVPRSRSDMKLIRRLLIPALAAALALSPLAGTASAFSRIKDLADVEGTDPVEVKLQLKLDGKIASETWMFQYHPF